MNNKIIFSLIVFALQSCFLIAQEVNYDQLERRDRIAYLKGSTTPFTGKAKDFHKNKNVKSEINFVNGYKEGVYKTWFESGNKEGIKYYKNNKLEGAVITWYDGGGYERKVEFSMDKKHGKFESYFKNGQLKEQGDYILGKKSGTHRGWYENGKLESEGLYVDDVEDGLHTEWYDTGKKFTEKNYKLGQELTAKYWAEDGHLMTADEVKAMLAKQQNNNLMQAWQQQQ